MLFLTFKQNFQCFHLCPLPPIRPLGTTEHICRWHLYSHQLFTHMGKIPLPPLYVEVPQLSASPLMWDAPVPSATSVTLLWTHSSTSRSFLYSGVQNYPTDLKRHGVHALLPQRNFQLYRIHECQTLLTGRINGTKDVSGETEIHWHSLKHLLVLPTHSWNTRLLLASLLT